ncbi:hypothetical protein LPJ56_004974, partial [Coemansia sp. RSA 2599]
NGNYESMLGPALKAKDPYRLQKVLQRMLVDNVRQGKHVNVSTKILHSSAYLILAKLLERREHAMVAAGETLGEIGWRTQVRPDILITVLAMAAHEAAGNEKEYMRSRMCLKWGPDNAALIRSVLQMRGLSLRLISDLFDAADDRSSIGRLEATRFYLACVRDGVVPKEIVCKLRSFHKEVVSDLAIGLLEKRKIGLSALALVHLHISAGDMDQANECLEHFAMLNVETQWPLGAVSAAIQHKYSTPKDMLPLLAAVCFDDFPSFVMCIEKLPVFRTRTVRAAMLRDELEIRRQMHSNYLPMTRFFVPRLIIRADSPDIHQLVQQHYSDIASSSVPATQLIEEASGLSFRLQSVTPLLMLTEKLTQSPELAASTGQSQLLASMTRVLDSTEMLMLLEKSDAKTRSAYIDIAANCKVFRKSLLQMYLRLGIEPTTEQLAIFHNNIYSAATTGAFSADQDQEQKQLASLTPHVLAHVSPRNLSHPRLASTMVFRQFYEQLLRRLAPRYPQAVLKLYEYVASHPSLTDHRFIMRYTTIMIEEYVLNGHFYDKGFFRLEKTL